MIQVSGIKVTYDTTQTARTTLGTGQRIRRAIDHLHHVESVLNNIGTNEPTEIVPLPQPTVRSTTPVLE